MEDWRARQPTGTREGAAAVARLVSMQTDHDFALLTVHAWADMVPPGIPPERVYNLIYKRAAAGDARAEEQLRPFSDWALALAAEYGLGLSQQQQQQDAAGAWGAAGRAVIAATAAARWRALAGEVETALESALDGAAQAGLPDQVWHRGGGVGAGASARGERTWGGVAAAAFFWLVHSCSTHAVAPTSVCSHEALYIMPAPCCCGVAGHLLVRPAGAGARVAQGQARGGAAGPAAVGQPGGQVARRLGGRWFQRGLQLGKTRRRGRSLEFDGW